MPAGRPPKWKFPDDFESAIEDYFESCFAIAEITKGEGENKTTETREVQVKPYTVGGLAYWLGLTEEGLREYGRKDEFSGLVKRAKQRIQAGVEEQLLAGKNATGPIFWLKNHAGWKDVQHNRHTFDYSKLSDEELEALAAGQGED